MNDYGASGCSGDYVIKLKFARRCRRCWQFLEGASFDAFIWIERCEECLVRAVAKKLREAGGAE